MHVTIIGKSLSEEAIQSLQFKAPLFIERVPAGFPSPAQDYVERSLDLNELCIDHPIATFFVRVKGDSMKDIGIFPNDVLVVDRSLQPCHDDIVIAEVDGEFTVKRLQLKPDVRLCPCNPEYPDIILHDDMTLNVFGIVTSVVRRIKRRV